MAQVKLSAGYPTPPVPPDATIATPLPPTVIDDVVVPGMNVPAQGLSPFNTYYTLGGLTLNVIDALGTKWMCGDPEGWHGGVAPARLTQQRQEGHGSYAGESHLEERPVTIRGTVIAQSVELAWAARDVMMGVAAALNALGAMDDTVQLMGNEPSGPKTLDVMLADKPDVTPVDHTTFQFTLPMVAPFPLKVGPRQQVRLTLRAGGVTALTFPVVFPAVFPAATTGRNIARVFNAGNFTAYPEFTVVGGTGVGPVFENLTTGEKLVTTTTLAPGDVFFVDSVNSIVTLNGENRGSDVQPGSVFPTLQRDASLVRFTMLNPQTDTIATLAYSSTWL